MLDRMESMHGQVSNTRDYQNYVMGVKEKVTLEKNVMARRIPKNRCMAPGCKPKDQGREN